MVQRLLCVITVLLLAGLAGAAAPVTDGLIVELRADSLGDLADGAAITYWPDTARDDAVDGSVKDIGYGTPQFLAAVDGLNGRPAVRFNGAQALASDLFDIDPAAGATVLAVFTGDESNAFHERLGHFGQRSATGSTLICMDVCTTNGTTGDDGCGFRLNNGRSLAINPNPIALDTTNFHVGAWAAAQGMRHADLIFYVDGVQQTLTANNPNNTMNFLAANNDVAVGDGHNPAGEFYTDDYVTSNLAAFIVYNRVLTDEEITTMSAYLRAEFIDPPVRASGPYPANESVDIPPYAELSWAASAYAGSHNVYFGDDEAAVQNATVDSPERVSLNQSGTSFDPGDLELGKTYYWRVDEVNAPPTSSTVYKGDVWSFTVEPLAYAVTGVAATTNLVSLDDQGPGNSVDGSGLDSDGLHSTDTAAMWSALPDSNGAGYIQFDLGRARKLSEMVVWNHNSDFELFMGIGLKDVTVEYSVDGADWTTLADVELARAPGTEGYAANSTVPLEGIAARYIRLTIKSTWIQSSPQVGLAEVQFMEIPTVAREPKPLDGATNVSVASMLSWRTARGVVSNDVSLSADANAVLEGTALVDSVTGRQYHPDGLLLDTTYYWKVDEVTEGDAVNSWLGDLWSFSTQEYIVVEDFELYDDDTNVGTAIWQTWIDGIDDPAGGGSAVGNDPSPFAELTIVHGGSQSMPLYYGNTMGFTHSEATTTYASPRNWAGNGIQSLSLFVYGDPTATAGQLYVKINGAKVYYDSVSNILNRAQWVRWPIDLTAVGTDLTNVRTLSIGIDGSGASGVLYVDDIHLVKNAVQMVEPTLPSDTDANLAAYYPFEGGVTDSQGAYDATATGSPEYVQGYAGQAIGLNGVNDTAISALAQEVVWPACSVSFWVQAGSLAQAVNSSMFNNNSSSLDFQMDVDGTDPGNYRYHGTVDMTFGPATMEWTHLAASCDGAQTRLYYNGLHAATIDVADTNFGQIAFGVNRAGDVWFNGLIDEARIYDRPLSAAEVAALAGITELIAEPF